MRRRIILLMMSMGFFIAGCQDGSHNDAGVQTEQANAAADATSDDAAGSSGIGVLVIAHGDDTPGWAEEINAVVASAHIPYPTEVGFLEMVPEATLEEAVRKLEESGVETIIAVPLLLSSRHSHGLEIECRLGLKQADNIAPVSTTCEIVLMPGMNGHPLIGALLLERALALSTQNATEPSQENVVLMIHGADIGWEAFRNDMDSWADYIDINGGFKDVRYGVLTPTFTMPTVVRDAYWESELDGGSLIIIPLVMAQGMYSENVFPALAITGMLGLGTRPVSALMTLIWSIIPEDVLGDMILSIMEDVDAWADEMREDEDAAAKAAQSQKMLRILETCGVAYTTAGIVDHPSVITWLNEMVSSGVASLREENERP